MTAIFVFCTIFVLFLVLSFLHPGVHQHTLLLRWLLLPTFLSSRRITKENHQVPIFKINFSSIVLLQILNGISPTANIASPVLFNSPISVSLKSSNEALSSTLKIYPYIHTYRYTVLSV